MGHREFLAEVFKGNQKRILEVATGTSTMSFFGSWFGFDVTSIDINPHIIERARLLANKMKVKVNYLEADTFDLPFADDTFDTAFHQGLMEHFTDDEIKRMLIELQKINYHTFLKLILLIMHLHYLYYSLYLFYSLFVIH